MMADIEFSTEDEADLAETNYQIHARLELAKHNASFAAQLAAAFMASGVIGAFAIIVIAKEDYSFGAAAFITVCIVMTAVLYFISRGVLTRRLPK
ncbi:hypothetical protein [Brucella anthropi]|uniref:hypothetical protein n=1 Tax=Brucella anthropi TaxID=529 RepID=UPI00125DD209|nr:hypothetical protein [Brucella anthropi]QFP61867.1 hypothetical protein FT787_01455 [Brucella anthropi]